MKNPFSKNSDDKEKSKFLSKFYDRLFRFIADRDGEKWILTDEELTALSNDTVALIEDSSEKAVEFLKAHGVKIQLGSTLLFILVPRLYPELFTEENAESDNNGPGTEGQRENDLDQEKPD